MEGGSPSPTRSSIVSESGWWRRVDSETEMSRTLSTSSERQLSTEGSQNLSLRTPVA